MAERNIFVTHSKLDNPPFNERFTKYDQAGSAGLAVMVIKDGKTVFQKGYGLRDLETKEKIDCDTNFRLASVSKQFTAMCVAILEEQGKISGNDFMSQYFSDLPEYMKEIKVNHLVHHLSGLPEYGDELWSCDKSKPLVSNLDVYEFYRKKRKLDFKPGEKYEYSNGGYSLLALLIENVTNQPFPEYINEAIFNPANMKNTAIIKYPSTIKNRAISYSAWPFFEDIDFNTGNAIYGEDGIYSSLTDIESWIYALENNILISTSMTDKVFSAAKNNGGDLVNYGYGWGIEELNKHKMVVHTGEWAGFNTIVAHIPDKRIWFVAFSNSRAIDSWSAMEEMAKYYLDIEIPC